MSLAALQHAEFRFDGTLAIVTGAGDGIGFASVEGFARGGARVIYYFLDESMPLYALLVYAKAEKADLTPDDKRAASALVHSIKAARKSK